MSPEQLSPGSIIDYPYLWAREHDAGETEGRKSRPVCLLASLVMRSGERIAVLFPITSQPPSGETAAVEIPQLELKRAGLDDRRAWVVVDQYNTDDLEQSWYFEPRPRRGAVSPAFLRRLLEAARPAFARRGAGVNRRT